MGDLPNQFVSQSLVYNFACLFIQMIVFASATLFVENLRFSLKDRENIHADEHQ